MTRMELVGLVNDFRTKDEVIHVIIQRDKDGYVMRFHETATDAVVSTYRCRPEILEVQFVEGPLRMDGVAYSEMQNFGIFLFVEGRVFGWTEHMKDDHAMKIIRGFEVYYEDSVCSEDEIVLVLP